MSDKDKLKKMFDLFGIGYKELGDGDIRCEYGDNKITGYICFYTIFSFDDNGTFIEMGAYE